MSLNDFVISLKESLLQIMPLFAVILYLAVRWIKDMRRRRKDTGSPAYAKNKTLHEQRGIGAIRSYRSNVRGCPGQLHKLYPKHQIHKGG